MTESSYSGIMVWSAMILGEVTKKDMIFGVFGVFGFCSNFVEFVIAGQC